jgi:hypothetical protein
LSRENFIVDDGLMAALEIMVGEAEIMLRIEQIAMQDHRL